MWNALAARPASCWCWWTPPVSAPSSGAHVVRICRGSADRRVDCLYVNYPGTAIVGYMRQMLAKSFVVAQYPKGAGPPPLPRAGGLPLRSRRGERPLAACPPARGEQRMAGADRGQGGRRGHSRGGAGQGGGATGLRGGYHGGGDAFAGGLIHGLARGMAMADALQCAVDWGAFAVASESSIPSQALRNWLKQPTELAGQRLRRWQKRWGFVDGNRQNPRRGRQVCDQSKKVSIYVHLRRHPPGLLLPL